MIKSGIQIEDGPIMDFCEAFGFIYIDADERTAADEKEDAVSNYPEQAGEHRDGRTCLASFDYTATFIIEAPNKNLTNVNARIKAFNDAIRERIAGSDIRRKREITFFNPLNRVKIVGYPELIAEPKQVYHSNRYGELDWAKVELKIRVSDPKKCDFNLSLDEAPEKGINVRLSTDGRRIYVSLSRALKDDESLLLLRRGRSVSRRADVLGGSVRWKGRFRWHVRHYAQGFSPDILKNGEIYEEVLEQCRFQAGATHNNYGVKCRKASCSKYFFIARTGLYKKITFGCAVYKQNTVGDKEHRPIRVSDVAYFVSNVRIDEAGTEQDNMQFQTWFTV